MALSEGKEAARQVWGASPAGCLYGEGAAIGIRECFENVIRKRPTYELPWLFEVFLRFIRPVPQKLLDRLARVLAWYVVVHARKL